MIKRISRRSILGTTLAATALVGGKARAATHTLNVLCHRVHQLCMTTGVAGDLTKQWRQANDAEIVWTTFDTDPLQDRLFREASLDHTDFGVGFLVNSRATPNAAALLADLNTFQQAAASGGYR